MANYLRYALTTLCFAASVGCLALWWRSAGSHDVFLGVATSKGHHFYLLETQNSYLLAFSIQMSPRTPPLSALSYGRAEPKKKSQLPSLIEERGMMALIEGRYQSAIYFPLWYPALIFALAGVGVLRFRRQFSIRSALIATTVVATLIGMAVIL